MSPARYQRFAPELARVSCQNHVVSYNAYLISNLHFDFSRLHFFSQNAPPKPPSPPFSLTFSEEKRSPTIPPQITRYTNSLFLRESRIVPCVFMLMAPPAVLPISSPPSAVRGIPLGCSIPSPRKTPCRPLNTTFRVERHLSRGLALFSLV